MLSAQRRQDLQYLTEKWKPEKFKDVDTNPYIGKVPDFLTELWKMSGAALWADGSYQTIDPEFVRSPVQHALRRSVVKPDDLVPYMMFAFGRLTCWHPDWGLVNIDPVEGSITVLKDPKSRLDPSKRDIEIMSAFIGLDGDETNFGLYHAAVKKFGSLKENEMFGFVPAIALGGRIGMQSIQKQMADVHLDILCQSMEFKDFRVEGLMGRARIVPM